MSWDVEASDEFADWWRGLTSVQKEAVDATVGLLEERGPSLGRPHADTLSKMSKYPNMKELRIQCGGDAYRVICAFDPRRVCILLLGGRKADNKWYKTAVPRADAIYEKYLAELRAEGLL